jgi:hypothetical protein
MIVEEENQSSSSPLSSMICSDADPDDQQGETDVSIGSFLRGVSRAL